MLSRVPLGSVLGPVLFPIYINELPEDVSDSTVRLFADDTLLYLTIHNSSDCDKLQEDLNNLKRWKSDWQMSFRTDKCEVIHITAKKTPILHSYSLHDITPISVPQIKYLYLGVHISQDLKWNLHINSISSKTVMDSDSWTVMTIILPVTMNRIYSVSSLTALNAVLRWTLGAVLHAS